MSPVRGGGRSFVMLALLVGASACHSYTPVTTPTPGSTVRVRIPVTSAAANPNAAPQTVSLEGQVLESGDTIVLATRTRREFGAFREIVQYDTLRLGPDQRYSVETVQFSNGKSIALGVGISVVVAGLAVAAFNTGGGGGPIGGGPGLPNPAIVSSSLISTIFGLLGGG